MKFIFLSVAICFCSSVTAQSINDVKKIEQTYSKCLKKGVLSECVYQYYDDNDSLLNLVYKNKLKNLAPAKKNLLVSEQNKWLKSKKIFFDKLDKEYEKEGGERDTTIEKMAKFLKSRVIELLNKSID